MARGTAQRIVVLRRRRRTMEQIAREVGVSRAGVARVLERAGLNRLSAREPAPLPKRCEWARPGDMLPIYTKKLARIERVGHRIAGDPRDSVNGAGREYAFVGADDNSRSGLVNESRTLRTGCTTAPGIALMPASADARPSAGSRSPGTTCRGSTAREALRNPRERIAVLARVFGVGSLRAGPLRNEGQTLIPAASGTPRK